MTEQEPNALSTTAMLVTSGMMDVDTGMVIALDSISKMDEANYFAFLSGELSLELRKLVHVAIHNSSDPNIRTWLDDGSATSRTGLQKLIAAAEQYGYDTSDFPTLGT